MGDIVERAGQDKVGVRGGLKRLEHLVLLWEEEEISVVGKRDQTQWRHGHPRHLRAQRRKPLEMSQTSWANPAEKVTGKFGERFLIGAGAVCAGVVRPT